MKLLPSIKEKFPRDKITIIIQLDGYNYHNIENDIYFKR